MAAERVQVGKYVDLMIDVAFKRVFGQPANKDLLIALLSVIIPEVKIDEITYLDKERNGSGLDDKKSVFDILCDTDQGEKVLVEVQVKPQKYFRDRTLYYAAQEILYEHRESDIDYTLSSLYVISLLDFELEHDSPAKDKFVWRYSLRENETGETMTKALNFTFVELSKFNKKESELANLEDGLYFCLKYMGRLSERPDMLDAAIFRKLFEVAEFVALPAEQRKKYIAEMTTERDIINQIAYAREKGEEAGMAKGKAEGIAEGEANGEAKARLQMAKDFKSNGVAIEIIAKCTGLAVEEVEAL